MQKVDLNSYYNLNIIGLFKKIADLPSYRVCSEHPFDTTGIDYAGPLLVKDVFTKKRVQE